MAGFSLMNGLSAAGSAVADYSTKVGLEAQKADLAKQSVVLADQLATNRALNVEQPFARSQQAALLSNQASIADMTSARDLEGRKAGAAATVSAAGIAAGASEHNTQAMINANAGLVAAQVADATARTGISNAQAEVVKQSTGITLELGKELLKPTDQQDPNKIASLQSTAVTLGMNAQTRAQMAIANDGLIKSAESAISSTSTALNAATAQLAAMNMGDPSARAAQQENVNALRTRLANLQVQSDQYRAIGMGIMKSGMGAPSGGATTPGGGTTTPAQPIDLSKFLPSTTPALAPAAGPRPGLMNNSAVPTTFQ